VSSHRYRGDNRPRSIEAKILFDADKLDVCGALGVARTLFYEGQTEAPLYVLDADGNIVLEGGGANVSSFFQEYHYKLRKVYNSFLTPRARALAAGREKAMSDFCEALYREIAGNHRDGAERLERLIV
jgi:uncharacterized protein